MPLVTLVGEKLAKEGKELVFCGMGKECKGCRLKSACLNLEEGRRYRIMNVRDSRHECKIHEGGVRVVEIEKVPIPATIAQKNIVEGAMISYIPKNCKNLGCQFYKLCHPLGLKNSIKGKVVGVGNEIDCPDGYQLVEIQLLC